MYMGYPRGLADICILVLKLLIAGVHYIMNGTTEPFQTSSIEGVAR